MWRGLGILKEEWQLTPQAVQIIPSLTVNEDFQ
jgi:hypothetical protein